MNRERQVELKLYQWLKHYVSDVYFNSKNVLDIKQFKILGSRNKPDLVLKLFNNDYVVIEVKDSSKSKNILMADKIIDKYYIEYVTGIARYYVNDKQIYPKYFLIATQESLKGHLFKSETKIDNWNGDSSDGKKVVSMIYGIIPRYEGSKTFEFVRFLWRGFSKIRNIYVDKYAVGILIANTNKNYIPYMQISNYNNTKKRWGQKWLKM